MRRWLIALFAVHFLMGVIGFAIPDHIVDMPVAGLATAAEAKVGTDSTAPSQKGLADLAHALADELPDLPDTLQRPAALALAHVLTPLQPQWHTSGLPTPLLEQPFRPPRRG
jgi:hypothetical protein